MRIHLGGPLLAAALFLGLSVAAQAQATIDIPVGQVYRSVGWGSGGGRPNVVSGAAIDLPYTARVEDIQPASYFEYRVTTTTPGMYTISLTSLQVSDNHAEFAFETRPFAADTDPFGTRYATQVSKDYGKYGAWEVGTTPRTYVDNGAIVDPDGATLTVPLWQGENILRIQNISGRHSPAAVYPPDLNDPNNRPWLGDFFWSNLVIVKVVLNRVGDLPALGTITGKVTGNLPAGVAVRRAIVTANPAGESPAEPSNFWKWGWYTYTKDDGTFSLQAPQGAQEVKAGRPSSYEVQGSPVQAVTVPATGSATANLSLTSLFKDDGTGALAASVQAEYADSQVGQIGLLPVDGENGYKVGWIDVGDTFSAWVDAPQAGYYKVASSYTNGGAEGTTRVYTDLGSSVQAAQPPGGWGTLLEIEYPGRLYLAQGPNLVSQTLISGASDFDGFHLTLLPDAPTVGVVRGTITDSITGQPVAGANVTVGTASVTTAANGTYSMVIDAGNNLTLSVTHPLQDERAPVTSTVNLTAGTTVTRDLSISVRPRVDLTTAAGYAWKVLLNTGGSADFSAVAANETGAVDITVPSNWDALTGGNLDNTYGWYRLRFTPPADFLTKFPNRPLVFRASGIDDVDAFYFNGTLIGATGTMPTTPLAPQPAGYTPPAGPVTFFPGQNAAWNVARNYIIPPSLVQAGENVIAIKVFDHLGGGGLTALPTLEVGPATGTVTGSVKAGGAGVPNVRVTGMDLDGLASDWTWTDASGNFTLETVITGPAIIGAAKPGVTATHTVVNVSQNATTAGVNLDVTNVADGPAPTYDDFSTDWTAKWDALSLLGAGDDANDPTVSQPGRNVNGLGDYPGTVTVDGGLLDRGGILSKARFSKYASVNAVRAVSALPAAPEPTGTLPNVILHLNGNPQEAVAQVIYGYWIELDIEGYSQIDGVQRLRAMLFAEGKGQMGQASVPVPIERLNDVTPENPLDLIIARTGTMYDFYVNNALIFSANVPTAITLTHHKLFPYSFQASSSVTWDWAKAGPQATVAPLKGDLNGNGLIDNNDVVLSLRMVGGLTATTAADLTAGDVITGGGIDLLDAARLLQAANGRPL